MWHGHCSPGETAQNRYFGMKNILIVDDEKTFLQLFVESLKDSHPYFNVSAAQNGKKVVEILESGPVDLVVADLRMPEMDGFELLAYLNSRFPSIPAIAMSAFSTPGLVVSDIPIRQSLTPSFSLTQRAALATGTVLSFWSDRFESELS